MRQYEVLMPECFNYFSCKGGDCRYTCCNGWDISFNSSDRKAMQKKDRELIEHVSMLEKDQQSGGNIYALRLDKNNNCPFLSEQKLCGIQGNYGPKPMPAICREFPRVYHKYLNKMEHGLSLGCEKVLELLYVEKDGLKLINRIHNFPDHQRLSSNANEKTRLHYPALTYYYDIQSLCLGVLQAEDAAIEDKMILLGMALYHIDCMAKIGDSIQIPSYIEKFINEMEAVDAPAQLQDIKYDSIKLYCSNLFSLLSIMDRSVVTDTPYNILASKLSKNLGLKKTGVKTNQENLSSRCTIEFSPDTYRKRQKGFHTFMKGKEYFLENLAVASLFYFNTPFRYPERGVWNDYLYFIWTQSILKFALTSLLDENSTEEELFDCCSVIFRKLGHSSMLYKRTLDDMEEQQTNTVAHMAVIIKSC